MNISVRLCAYGVNSEVIRADSVTDEAAAVAAADAVANGNAHQYNTRDDEHSSCLSRQAAGRLVGLITRALLALCILWTASQFASVFRSIAFHSHRPVRRLP